jgi:type VII secretion integral membrane protein EccD
MTGSFFTITVVGARRRIDLRLPADVPVGELAGELAALLDEPVEGPPPRWGLVRLDGQALDAERGLAAQQVPAGAMLFIRDLGVAEPPAAVDDYPNAVAAVVEASPGRWTPAAVEMLLVAAAAMWVAGAGVLALRALLDGATATTPGLLAGAVALAAIGVGRALGSPRAGAALALAALPLWAAAGAGIGLQLWSNGLAGIAGGLAAVTVGGATAAAAAGEGVVPAVGLAAAAVPWAVTLALCVWLRQEVAVGAAVLVPVALTALRLLPWVTVRLASLEAMPDALPARTAAARRLLGALTAGTALALAGAGVVLAAQPGGWARALAVTTAVAALLHGRRRRFAIEVAPLWLVALAALATFELRAPVRPEVLVATAAVLVPLGMLGRRVRLPVGVRRQLERLESLAAAATVPLAFGLLGLYDVAARVAGRFA